VRLITNVQFDQCAREVRQVREGVGLVWIAKELRGPAPQGGREQSLSGEPNPDEEAVILGIARALGLDPGRS
jgi:hypothetical protein